MPRPLPTPVAALVGLVPTVADHVRQLPLKAVRLPVVVLSSALTQADRTKAEYDALAERGAAFVGRLRGTAEEFAEEVSERADDLAGKVEELTPLAETPDPTPVAEQPKGEPTAKAPKAPKEAKIDTAASPAAALAAELVAAASAAPDVDHDALPLPDYDHM
ncbi:MAG: hypothetical protein JWP68_296, partial [Modestobacter sp.]|nr:hypothetical protein [Modestobacter sp.]